MKKSIALFIVLSFLIILMTLLSSIFLIYKKYSKSNENIYNQTSVMINNIVNSLNNLDINSSEELKKMFTSFPFSSSNGDFRGVITIKPLFNKINLNEYLQNNKINPTIDMFLNNLLETYNVADPLFFKDLILDSLDLDTNERMGYSEIILENKNFKNGSLTFKKFKYLLKYYAEKRDDKSVFHIPWKNLIFFANINTPLVCDFVDKNLTEFLGVENDLCKIVNKSNQVEKKLKFLDIIPFAKNIEFWIKINVNYVLRNKNNKFTVIYDINNKKVISIESYPVY